MKDTNSQHAHTVDSGVPAFPSVVKILSLSRGGAVKTQAPATPPSIGACFTAQLSLASSCSASELAVKKQARNWCRLKAKQWVWFRKRKQKRLQHSFENLRCRREDAVLVI